ncbi:hypothetical protein I8748_05635 [Nostoc sp. CENA67]|uniref:Uncharacterized protein n=1 Tax=Amazonocrinis nigriterrae CENA67 TaxID=2794033 RepID=A0A8J7HQI4_9NOST|nr:hypothetical protein [Amazonocrinis nigriterrae]MBH8561665.1 hypothetical protein [Amazonocrinis nigriterrae CENA67]
MTDLQPYISLDRGRSNGFMNKQERKQTFFEVFTDASCPKDLADKAACIASKYYPAGLIGATEEEVNTFKQAQDYLTRQEQ